jgi:hypothetical protein
VKGKTLVVNLPFPGLYESSLDHELDSVIDQEIENLVERQEEDRIPKELHLDSNEMYGALSNCIQYRFAHQHLASRYAGHFGLLAGELLGFELGLEYESMTSPKEYNFTTDMLFAHIPRAVVRRLFKMSKQEEHATLAKVIRKRFTSRSGFISFYSNELEEWLEKPVQEWDYHELGTLLRAVLEIAEPEAFSRADDAIEWKVYENMCEAGDFYEALDGAVNWHEFEAKVEEIRDQKRLELDPNWVPPTPRCTRTIDMFTGKEG